MAELLIRVDLADAKALSLPAPAPRLPPRPSNIKAYRKYKPACRGEPFRCYTFCFSKCTLCWGFCVSGLSLVWETCEGALSTHSPPPSGSSSPAGDTHLYYGMLLSLPLSVSMASTLKRFSSDYQHSNPPHPPAPRTTAAHIVLQFLIQYVCRVKKIYIYIYL